MSTDVSEEHIISIFRVEKKAEQENSVKAGGKQNRPKMMGMLQKDHSSHITSNITRISLFLYFYSIQLHQILL
jgi:hypothetical protein